ncbi:MAG: hypothetical protein AAFN12_18720, partial [Cyanobacteria bacterium J06560_2]
DETYTVSYKIEDDLYTFEFIDPSGNSTVETYTAGAGGNGAGEPPPPQNGAGEPPPPRNGAGEPPPPPNGRPRNNKEGPSD